MNNQNISLIQESAVCGSLTPSEDGVFDLGTQNFRFGSVFCTGLVGSISDPDVEVGNLRFPSTGPFDVKLSRTGAASLELDNNSGGSVDLTVVGNINANTFKGPTGSIAFQSRGDNSFPTSVGDQSRNGMILLGEDSVLADIYVRRNNATRIGPALYWNQSKHHADT